MAKQIAKLLKADSMSDMDLKGLAQILRSKGRGRDSMLAHITPKEAELLRSKGGSGTINPDTGLPEFDTDSLDTWFNDYYSGGGGSGGGAEYQAQGDFKPPAYMTNTSVEAQPLPASDPNAYVRTTSGDGGPAVNLPSADSSGAYSGNGVTLPYSYQATPTSLDPFAYGTTFTRNESPYSLSAPSEYRLNAMGDGTTPAAGPSPQQQQAPKTDSGLFGMKPETLARLGLAGGLGIYGAMQNKRAADQIQEAQKKEAAIGAPYQAKGKELQRAAEAGELTNAGLQSFQAMQARLAQGVEQRGGAGSVQAMAQLEAFRQQLLQNQYDYGIKVSQIGDQIALGAIRTGMQADQQLNQANMGFYTSLASIAAGIPSYRTAP